MNKNQNYVPQEQPKEEKEDLTRPTFKNSNFEGEKKFKDLDTNGDLYLKKLKEREMLEGTQINKTDQEEKNSKEVFEEIKNEENEIKDFAEEKVNYYDEPKRFYQNNKKDNQEKICIVSMIYGKLQQKQNRMG